MKQFLKSMDWLMLLTGILTVLFGLALLFVPALSLTGLAVLLGILVITAGVCELINVLRVPDSQRFGWMVLECVITILIGAWMIIGHGIQVFWNVLPFVYAALIMANGIIRIENAFTLRAQGAKKWKWMMGLGIGEDILGFILLFAPLLSVRVGTTILALLLVLYGASNVALALNADSVGGFLRNLLGQISPRESSRA